MADRSVVYRLTADIGQFKAQMAQAGLATKKAADDLTSMEKSAVKSRQGLATLGNTAGTIGLVAAAGLGAAVLKAANFDEAMSSVQAATHETAGNMDLLRQAALDAGAATSFSATEAAAGIENLAKAGVSTKDILGGGLNGALDLAAAGSLEVADAAEIAATALTQFSLSGEDVPHVADLLAAGAGKAQGEVSDLGMALKQSGLVAAQMGLSIEETVGSLSAFASAGLLGSDAGTSLKTMLLRLANPAKESAELMDQLGISAYDASGQFVGIQSLAEQLTVAFEGKTQAERDSAMATIFGSDAIRAANVLYNQGAEGIADWTSKVNDQGFAAETAATKLDNLKGDLEGLSGALETALIGTGDGSQGALRSLVQGLTDVVNAYNKLPPAAQTATGAILGGVALLGGSIWVGSKLIQGIANTRDALNSIPGAAGKASTAMRGLAKAGVALAALEVGTLALKGLDAALAETLPGTEALTGRLLDLNSGEIKSLGGEFDSLGSSIDRLTSENNLQHAGDELIKLVSFGQLSGTRSNLGAAREIEAIDAAVTNLVNSAGPEAAALGLENIAKAEGLSADQLTRLKPLLTAYNEARAGAANAEEIAAGATKDGAAATADSTGALEANTQSLRENIEAMRARREAALSAFDAETSWRQAVVAATKAAKETNAGIRGSSQAALENREALSSLASAWNGQSAAVKNSESRFRDAKATFIDTAVAMGVPKKAAEALARQLLEIPQKVATDVTVNAGDAMRTIGQIQYELQQLDGHRATTYVDTVYTASGRRFKDVPSGVGSADGGSVPKTGLPYADRHPYLLADGEEVISNRYGQADKWRSVLKAINAGRLADGGTVGAVASRPSAISVAAPTVSVGGAAITVVVDGVSHIARAEANGVYRAQATFDRRMRDRD